MGKISIFKVVMLIVVTLVIIGLVYYCYSYRELNLFRKEMIKNGENVPSWFDLGLYDTFRDKLHKDGHLDTFARLGYAGVKLLGLFTSHFQANLLTWDKLETIIETAHIPFRPDIVIGVKSGGAFIARKVQLECMKRYSKRVDLDYVRVTFKKNIPSGNIYYEECFRNGGGYVVLTEPLSDETVRKIEGKKVLLVDDQTASGATMKLVKSYIRSLGAADVKGFVIYDILNTVDFSHAKFVSGICWPWGCQG
jgi:hypoxanthine phosphoribosyltransferase